MIGFVLSTLFSIQLLSKSLTWTLLTLCLAQEYVGVAGWTFRLAKDSRYPKFEGHHCGSLCMPGMSSPASVTDPHPHGEAQGMDGLRKGAHQGRLPQTGWVWEAFFLEGRCGPMQATV